MNTQILLNSRLGVGLALLLGRYLPAQAAHRFAGWAAAQIASRSNSLMVCSIQANHWVVNQGNLSMDELDQLAQKTLYQAGVCLYDFYHVLQNPQEILRLVTFTPQLNNLVQDCARGEDGVMFVTPHTSNFDLAGQALALRGLQFQALSYPRPPAGYQWQNKIRGIYGIEVTPASKSSIKMAKERLQKGGAVLTGLDRPLADTKYLPRFFGRPAAVPVGHIHLAMQTHVPVVVVACHTNPDGTYLLQCSEKIWMKPGTDKNTATIENAELVLAAAERYILQDTTQWSMFYPVWPEALTEVPNAKN